MLTLIAVLAPLFGSVLAGVGRPFLGRQLAIGASILFMIISAIAGVTSFVTLLHVGVPAAPLHVADWIAVGGFNPGWTLRQDMLTLVMVAMVSSVSLVIHIYSVGYMEHDKTAPRFFAYISLFTFAMLMLVTSNNLVQLFFGWEGVGLVSYLLINYWYDRPAANAAAIKAMIVNRIGDLFFAVGIALAYLVFNTISFDGIFAAVTAHAGNRYALFGTQFPALEVISILLFIGAMGKSAQFLLHTWLADAMEGPTPISALIHAATMVAAGVFMIVRMSPLINHAPVAMEVITVIGATTAFFAGTVGCVQNDIKRIIAYSTCSQLGYMFLAAGLGAYPVAMFHLINHAFFKALLFLAAGSVIHAMSDEQDVRLMGGLWRKLPVTWVTLLIGGLALSGIPPFSGYYSKDAILGAAFASHSAVGMYGWVLGTVTAGLTAFYTARLVLLTFHGTSRAPKHVQEHVHESPLVILGPLVLLAIGAVSSGFLFRNAFIGGGFSAFWGGSIAVPGTIMQSIDQIPAWAALAPLTAAIIGLAVAAIMYILVPSLPGRLSQAFRPLYLFVLNKWYFDEIYDALLVRPSLRLAKFAWRFGDEQVIDGVPTGLATLTADASTQTVKLQTGSIALYAFIMLIGLLVFLSLFLWVR
ncbi:NADH-quinone oxidoreductase subunit L [Acidocella sp.]|jgi:NADH-quinone oxidoreductase subunit L|uniref:NADH-quinone oxidoreductase subunit L n=1 Tax=Acidocella sp. TaxID=50710 RepID=UPI002F40CE84